MNKLAAVAFLAAVATIVGVFTAQARPIYARKENKTCGYCHLSPAGSVPRTFRGLFYGANNLSFDAFEEKREAHIAAAPEGAMAGEAAPKIGYLGNISGPAAPQIGVAALRGPVLVAFLDGGTDDAKAEAKVLRTLAEAYGTSVTVVAVAPVSAEAALKLTAELGNTIRVLPDPEKAAVKKFGAKRGLDLVVIAKLQEKKTLVEGFSAANLGSALATLAEYGVPRPSKLDLTSAPKEAKRGKSLLDERP